MEAMGRDILRFSAPWVEHGIFGGPEPKQVSHLVAELGEVLAQIVQILHGGLVCALHLLPRGGQVAVNQATHDLLVILITLLFQILPLLHGKEREGQRKRNNTFLCGMF